MVYFFGRRRFIVETQEKQSPWSIREAKSRLSEVLRRAREAGPQLIGKRNQCVVISREEWEAQVQPEESMVAWLLGHSPQVELEVPARGESGKRPIPFVELDS
jgi:prevent-host-death family protein